MDIDFLHKCALEDCTEQHQFSNAPDVIKVGPYSLQTYRMYSVRQSYSSIQHVNQFRHEKQTTRPYKPPYFLRLFQEMDQLLLTFGDIPHHGPVLLAWVLLRHTLRPDESSPVIRRIGNTALQLGVFKYITTMLRGLGASGNNVREHEQTRG